MENGGKIETKGNDRGNFPLRLLFSPDGILTSNRATRTSSLPGFLRRRRDQRA